MLNCESCNYIKTIQAGGKGKSLHICEFTGVVFQQNPGESDLELHPCHNKNYKTYELEQKNLQANDCKTA